MILATALTLNRIAAALLLSVATTCPAFGADDTSGPKSIPELQMRIETVLQETKTPGAAIAIVSRDKVEWVAGQSEKRMFPLTTRYCGDPFRIGSVSKSFAALAALKLQEEGKLKADGYSTTMGSRGRFTNPWEATDPVRLVHLMEHTTGFDEIHLREFAAQRSDAGRVEGCASLWRVFTRMPLASRQPDGLLQFRTGRPGSGSRKSLWNAL